MILLSVLLTVCVLGVNGVSSNLSRPRDTTPVEDRYMAPSAKKRITTSVPQLAADHFVASGMRRFLQNEDDLAATSNQRSRWGYYPLVYQFICGTGYFASLSGDDFYTLCKNRNYTGIAQASNGAIQYVLYAQELCRSASLILQYYAGSIQRYCRTDGTTSSPTTIETTTETPETTTYIPTTCAEVSPEYDKGCNESCLDRGRYIYLGGDCQLTYYENQNSFGASCSCVDVTHCENYKNATCQRLCRKRSSNGFCRIPERNISCACRFRNKRFNYTRYEYP